MSHSTAAAAVLSDLRQVVDERGTLVAIEEATLPFPIHRVFFITKVSHGATRAGHSHQRCSQLILAAGGAFTAVTDDGISEEQHRLDRPDLGLRLMPGTWCELRSFTDDAVCLVLASHPYDPDDLVADRPGRRG